MGLSPARARVIADQQFSGGAPANWFVGLALTEPSDDGLNFVEPVGMGYVRVQVANNATNWPAAATSGGVTLKSNGIKVTWPNATGTWGAVRAWGVFLAASGGVPEFFNRLDDPITVTSSSTPIEIDIGQLLTEWGG